MVAGDGGFGLLTVRFVQRGREPLERALPDPCGTHPPTHGQSTLTPRRSGQGWSLAVLNSKHGRRQRV